MLMMCLFTCNKGHVHLIVLLTRPCFCVGRRQNRTLERLLHGSSSSLSSSAHSGLAAVGRAVSTGAEATAAPAPAASSAASCPVQFPFDFFEKTRCISGDVQLSGDLAQTGARHIYATASMLISCSCLQAVPEQAFAIP